MLSIDVGAWCKVWCVLWRRNIPGSGSRKQPSERGGKKVNQAKVWKGEGLGRDEEDPGWKGPDLLG